LEPNASLFAVQEACEPVHIMLNEKTRHLMVVNNHPEALADAKVHAVIYNLDGKMASESDVNVTAAPSAATDFGLLVLPDNLSHVYFVKLQLHDADGKFLSDNFYWNALAEHRGDLQALNQLPTVTLDAKVTRRDAGGKCLWDVTLHNPTSQIALMAHLQLRRQNSGARVLPVYYSDNYVSLTPGESKTITIEAAQSDLRGERPLIVVDGWNIGVTPFSSDDASIALNEDAQVNHWPVTGLPIVPSTYVYVSPPSDNYKINCGGSDEDGFNADANYLGGNAGETKRDAIDTTAPTSGPVAIYQSERWGESVYPFRMKPLSAGHTYTVRLHFAETTFNAIGARKFNVEINGNRVLSDFDVFQEAGGKDKALVKEFPDITSNGDGEILIKFDNGSTDNPEVNAIEISPANSRIPKQAL
jgi:hypothetical protein